MSNSQRAGRLAGRLHRVWYAWEGFMALRTEKADAYKACPQLELSFPSTRLVPPLLFLISANCPTIHPATQGKYNRRYHLSFTLPHLLPGQSPQVPSILIAHLLLLAPLSLVQFTNISYLQRTGISPNTCQWPQQIKSVHQRRHVNIIY